MKALCAIPMALLVVCCQSEPPSRETPTAAFAGLAPCVDRADTGCLFEQLDRDSRWSLHSIHRTLSKTRKIVESSYPADEKTRADAFGAWLEESKAPDPVAMFAVFCEKRKCLHGLASGFGTVMSRSDSDTTSTQVVTSRGGKYRMSAAEGEWGLSTYREELLAEKIRLADNLEQVVRNGAAFDEQRLATGEKGKGE